MKSSRVHVVARLDAHHDIGHAHAVRVGALLSALPFAWRLSVAGAGDALTRWFPEAQHLRLPAHGEDETFFASLRDLAPDLVLVDRPDLGARFWQRLRDASSCVIALDDEGGPVQADLVINGTVLDQYHRYPQLGTQATVLLGPRHALLRPDFAANPWRDPDAPGVTAVVGGGERASQWADRLSQELAVSAPLTLVVGASHPDRRNLQARCETRGIKFASGLSGSALAAQLASSTAVLVTGGMIVYEALAVGVPAVVFPQEPNLPPEAEWFAARGAIANLGFEDGFEPAQAAATLEGLLADRDRRRSMSAVQRTLVDGQGLARAAAAVTTLVAGR